MSPRPVAEHEVRRILALVPWIVAHPGTHTSEIARRFGISERQLDSDLDLALMVGVPPYSPGDYLDVERDDEGRVTIRLADYFRRPLRMTPAEGLALLAAARALLAVPGSEPDGALARAVDKLADVLRAPDVDVDVAAPELLAEVRAAAHARERVEIDYWSANRDEVLTRVVDPAAPFYALGAWYVPAYCHRAGDERLFRVDRIRALRCTGEHFERADDDAALDSPSVFQPGADDPRVTLVLQPNAAWLPEVAPTETVEPLEGGALRVTLVVTEPAWLERLLLRLGPSARVEAPPDARATAAGAAARVLRRYGRPQSGRPVRA
ncbi:MAG TPA: WYL domain-containing protein [Acidimicrobiia bacterium]|nr:WYL domain-containing protein [Acidimicrobiia bacterium]